MELKLDKKIGSVGKTPWKTISARVYGVMKDNPNSKYAKIGKRPTRFHFKEKIYHNENALLERIEEKEQKDSQIKSKINERDLHPLLVKFVNEDQHSSCYCKTIYHESSKTQKLGKNKWLHPDIVGVYYPFRDLDNVTSEVQKALETSTVKLFSFELKLNLDFATLREYYFQAVSNSSWANEGYLVCLNIKEDIELMNELQRLNSAFGIGIILLNVPDTSQSEILFPAQVKSGLDWLTIDRLISDNPDFREFMVDMKEDTMLRKLKGNYDKVLSDEQMENYITSKQIS